MKPLRIGFVEYINAFPFTLPFRVGEMDHDIHFTCAPPNRLNALLENGELDIALTSSVLGFQDGFESLDSYCIAAHKKILSVNLYSKLPIEKLSGVSIGVISQSMTAVELLKILCRDFWKIDPCFSPFEERADHSAFLLIGDRALKQRTINGYETHDLAEAWNTATGLPFVFATFVFRSGLELDKGKIHRILDEALKWSARHPDLLIAEAQKQTALDEQIIQNYFELCHYRLSDKELKGLEAFRELATNHVPSICT